MASPNQKSIRFGLLTSLVWVLVAGGIIFLLWTVIMRISGQNLPISTPTPNLTQVYQTIAVILTAQEFDTTSTSTPTISASPGGLSTQTPSTPVPTRQTTPIPRETNWTSTPAFLCDRAGAGNPIDVSIPDDSEMSPGESFIKTWKLVNTGTCTWTTLYSARFFYGDRMEAPEMVPLHTSVPPAQDAEISVEMTAPQSPGTYQGNWKLCNETGVLFGIGPNADSPFWVRIIVLENETLTPTATAGVTPILTPTGVISPTETPPGDNGGKLYPIPGDTIDLDALTLNGEGTDMDYQADQDGYHWLAPLGGAVIGIYGSQQPTLPDCQAAGMSAAPIGVESLPVGTYLCYTTGEGRPGRMLLEAVNPSTFALSLDLLTWAMP